MEKTTKKWSKILLSGMSALLLAFGLVFTGCGDGAGGGTPPGGGDPPGGGTDYSKVTDSKFDTTDIRGVAYGGGKFVAVGGGKSAYSTDGTTWTTVTVPGTTPTLNAVAHGGSKFVAVGGNKILSSAEGTLNWTALSLTSEGYTLELNDVIYDSSKFVVIGTETPPTGNKAVVYFFSTDISNLGTTAGWNLTKGVSSQSANLGSNAIASNGTTAYVFDVANGTVVYSNAIPITGESIPVATLPGDAKPIRAIAFGGGKFVAGDYWGKLAYSSNNGSSWTAITGHPFALTSGYPSVEGIHYGNSKFVAVGEKGVIAESSDGTSWSQKTTSGISEATILYDAASSSTKTVVVGKSGTILVSN